MPARLFSYVVARDFGFAPNPFHGYCTLCTCKPVIRRVANTGDWILGTGSKKRERDGRAVFAMCVTEILTFDEYWEDQRFLAKRPNLRGSQKQAFGDNIYHRVQSGNWIQEDSHHSLDGGIQNPRNIANDTQTDRVLISDDYVYWGDSGPKLPGRFRDHGGIDICTSTQGHKSRIFTERLIGDFIAWVRQRDENGYVGDPLDWDRTP